MNPKKKNIRPRRKENLPKMLCSNGKCLKFSTPLIKVELEQVAYITFREDGEDVRKIPHSITSTTTVYCRHCKTPIWQGVGVASEGVYDGQK